MDKPNLTGFKGDPNDCYNRALPDEPVFTLLARDLQSPALVRKWANDREDNNPLQNEWVRGTRRDGIETGEWVKPPHPDDDIIAHARYLAARMEVWRYENDGKWREPPAGTPLTAAERKANGLTTQAYDDAGNALRELTADDL